jgi:hypothetical protein
MPTEYYRYISKQKEADQITDDRIVESVSKNPETWYSPNKYNNKNTAERELAMPKTPQHRIGPINDVKMPSFSAGPKKVQPNFSQPGGGVEVSVQSEINLFGLWDYDNNEWEMG